MLQVVDRLPYPGRLIPFSQQHVLTSLASLYEHQHFSTFSVIICSKRVEGSGALSVRSGIPPPFMQVATACPYHSVRLGSFELRIRRTLEVPSRKSRPCYHRRACTYIQCMKPHPRRTAKWGCKPCASFSPLHFMLMRISTRAQDSIPTDLTCIPRHP